MDKKQSPSHKVKKLLKQVTFGFKSNKNSLKYTSEVHDIFQKKTTSSTSIH